MSFGGKGKKYERARRKRGKMPIYWKIPPPPWGGRNISRCHFGGKGKNMRGRGEKWGKCKRKTKKGKRKRKEGERK
jgi:hypothetical protein